MTNKKSLTIILLISGTLLVLILVGALVLTSYRHQKNTRLYDDGLAAFQQGNYDVAYESLKSYLGSDPNHEEAWKMLAEIEESRGHIYQAAMLWRRLSRLNVLEEDYVRKYVNGCYRCHAYNDLYNFLDKCDEKWRSEYKVIHALSAFKTVPNDKKTTELLDALPSDSGIAHLIQVLKNHGPEEEITKLENSDDPVLQVEAFIIDGYISEFKNKDLAHAENCFVKAAELNKLICQGEYGDFLFRGRRYKEAFEVYSRYEDALLSMASFINYAETAYAMNDTAILEKIGQKFHNAYPSKISELAYIHALKAHLDGNAEHMKSNYLVAKQHRGTPMSMRLSYAVAIANSDILLLAQSIKVIATSPSFAGNRQQILQQITPILQANSSGDNLGATAQIAELFLDMEPANELVWRIVILNKWQHKSLQPEMLNKAIELFPSESLFRQLFFLQVRGDANAASEAFDQWIAVSDNPTIIKYRKAEFLQQNGKIEEATAEIVKMSESDNSVLASKLCLIFGLKNSNRTAIKQAGKCEELKPITSFELERRYGNKAEAERMLHATRIEDAFTVKQTEDQPIMMVLAVYLAIIHEVDRSIAVYEQLKSLASNNAVVELNLSELYASKGDKEQAMENAKSALRRLPNSSLVRAIYGLRCAESADFTKAIAYIPDTTQDKRLNGALAYSLEKLIIENYESGHLITVREQLERLRKVNPDSQVLEEYTKKLAEQQKAEADK